MDMLDLLAMRESYTQQRIMLCFNGPISRSLIEEIGNALRNYLAAEQAQPSAAMDVFAVYIEMTQNIRHYALQQGYGEQVQELKGGRRALGDKRQGEYHNQEMRVQPGWTFYLCTDGFLDQAGGEHGFGFGNARFIELLRSHARRPLREQAELFVASLEAYQGGQPQRDDITVLSFRFD